MCQSFRIPSCGFTTTCLSICQLLGLCLFLATSDCLEESCYDHPCVSPCVDGCSILGAGKRGLLAVWLCVLNFIRNHCLPSRAAVPFCMCSSELIRVPVFVHHLQRLMLSAFYIFALLVAVQGYLIVVVLHIFLITVNNAAYSFMCSLAVLLSFLWRVCSSVLPIFFKVGCLVIESYKILYVFWIQVLCHIYTIFSQSVTCIFLDNS